MNVGRNEPCPCGSGRKYKHCCLHKADPGAPASACSPRFQFDAGSYGGPGGGYLPSAMCREQAAPGLWHDYFCLVKPCDLAETEDEASATAARDLAEAFASKEAGGSGQELAESLRAKGYVSVEGFRRASTAGGADS